MPSLPIVTNTAQPLGQGAQGIAEKVIGNNGQTLVLKKLPHSPIAETRIAALTSLDLYSQNPFLAAPTQ